ncbi:hypothetical protein IWQ61_001615 [Dispira simplex]|nr:hypothetical protein IWQ61_001615 [Dispira simplex]
MPPFGAPDKGKAPATITPPVTHASVDETVPEETHSHGTPVANKAPGLANRLLRSARTLLNPTLTPSDINTTLDVRLDQGKSTHVTRHHSTSQGSTTTPELYEYEAWGCTSNSDNGSATAHLSHAASVRSEFLSPGRIGPGTLSAAQRTGEDSLTQLCTAVNQLDLPSTSFSQDDPVLHDPPPSGPTTLWRAPPTHEVCHDIVGLLNHSQGLFDEVFYMDPRELTHRQVNQRAPLATFSPNPPYSSRILEELTDNSLEHALQFYLTEFTSYTDEVYGTGITSSMAIDRTSRIFPSDNDHSQDPEGDVNSVLESAWSDHLPGTSSSPSTEAAKLSERRSVNRLIMLQHHLRPHL